MLLVAHLSPYDKIDKKAPQPAGGVSLGELKNFGIVERHREIVGFLRIFNVG